jgi:hypothetical protein
MGDGEGERPPAPRWVKFGVVATGVVVALVIVMLLVGGGEHGPGRHLPGNEDSTSTSHVPVEHP